MRKKLILFAIIFLIGFSPRVYAYETYKLSDFIYFDPVSDEPCNENNYWTIYNQSTTCYRFFSLNNEDDNQNPTLKVILDHDIAFSTFNAYEQTLKDATKDWNRYNGEISIIDEDVVANVMKLGDKRPDETNNYIPLSHYSLSFSPFEVNSLYYKNGEYFNTHGFWVNDLKNSNNNYAYSITENGNNAFTEKQSVLGIRPVIDIDKSLLTKSNLTIDISSELKLFNQYSYINSVNSNNGIYNGFTYNHLQGFTFTNDKLVFASYNSENPKYAVLFSYGGGNYNEIINDIYVNIGHANGMTYNKKEDEILIVHSNGDIIIYDNKTMNYKRKINLSIKVMAIGYDNINDLYFARDARRVYLLDNSFNIKNSFDAPIFGVYQDIEYKNGYVYVLSYEPIGNSDNTKPCRDSLLYCLEKPRSSIIYIYNGKLNSDGEPSNNFGKLVKKLYIKPGYGEIEGISFKDDSAFIGYATANENESYKFYKVPYSKISTSIGDDSAYNDQNVDKSENNESVIVPDTKGFNSTLLLFIAMVLISLGIGVIAYVRKNRLH